MFRHLLVPLDGSRLAESALPAAVELARRLGARVTLFHALEPAAPATVHGERHITQRYDADAHLREASEWVSASGVNVDSLVRPAGSDVAAAIAAAVREVGADLTVITSHGRGSVRGLLFGRVAQQVLQRGSTPVLLVQPSSHGRTQPFSCHRILVPLDGSEMAETALPSAAAIADTFGAETLLVMIVPTVETVSGDRAATARLMPTAAGAMLDAEAAQAVAYLRTAAHQWQGGGRNVSVAVERGEPGRALLDTAGKQEVDLIVLATHGRSGMGAVWAGSIASRIVAQGTRHVLLIRIASPS